MQSFSQIVRFGYILEWDNLFITQRYNNDWSGLYNGQPLPESSYVYLIDNNGDGKIDQKGWIYIAR